MSIDNKSEIIRGRNLQPSLFRDSAKVNFLSEIGDRCKGLSRLDPLRLAKIELILSLLRRAISLEDVVTQQKPTGYDKCP